MAIDVQAQLLAFSASLPRWQQDALRRLVLHRALSPGDLSELTNLAKLEAGIGSSRLQPLPLSADHLSLSHASGAVPTLASMYSVRNVNALVEGQRLDFEPMGLTVIYGENGTGKSGYTRVLRKACRARKAPDIAPNAAFASAAVPEAVFELVVEGTAINVAWKAGQPSPEELARFCVFDRECEKGFVDEEGEITFLPAGLDVFQRLAQVVDQVKRAIEQEQAAVAQDDLTDLLAKLGGDTSSRELIQSIQPELPDPRYEGLLVSLSELALGPEGEAELAWQKQRLTNAGDPVTRARELRSMAASLHGWRLKAENAAALIGDQAVPGMRTAWELQLATAEAAEAAEVGGIAYDGAVKLGGPAWRELYKAAEKFAITEMDPSHPFPNIDEGARCPLCLQPLREDARDRFARFKDYMKGELRTRADEAVREYEDILSPVRGIQVSEPDPVLLGQVQTLCGERAVALADALHDLAPRIHSRRNAITSLACAAEWDTLLGFPADDVALIRECEDNLERLAAEIGELADAQVLESIRQSVGCLEARKALAENEQRVKECITKLRLSAALRRCHSAIGTRRITDEGRALTDAILTGELQEAFHREMGSLGAAGRIGVSVGPRGQKGRTVYGIALDGSISSAWKISQILSEGEQRVVALAYFFAEVAMTSAGVGVILDDPVCSLDHRWAKRIAKRLVEIGRDRQVIIFTHSISFLIELDRVATDLTVPMRRRYITRRAGGPGYCDAESAPWERLDIKTRIQAFENQLDQLRTAYAAAPDGKEYINGTIDLCNALRAGWERAVEEVLLNGVVERFGHAVKTNSLSGVEVDDQTYKAVNDAMTRLSADTDAHDHAGEALEAVKTPEELAGEIRGLKDFVKVQKEKREATAKSREKMKKPPIAETRCSRRT